MKKLIIFVLFFTLNLHAAQNMCSNFFSPHLPKGLRMEYSEHFNGRFSKAPEKGDAFIVAIPGGPGISGKYMDQFISKLGVKNQRPTAVLNLPAHNESANGKTKVTSFDNGLEQVKDQITAIVKITGVKPTLVSHSFGGFLTINLILKDFDQYDKIVLLNTPSKFERDDNYLGRSKEKNIREDIELNTEADFLIYWKHILPLYFKRDYSKKEEALLASETFYFESIKFSENMPHDIQEIKVNTDITKDLDTKLLLVESDTDLITPTNNLELLKKTLGVNHSSTIEDSGHFPMLEQEGPLINTLTEFIKGE